MAAERGGRARARLIARQPERRPQSRAASAGARSARTLDGESTRRLALGLARTWSSGLLLCKFCWRTEQAGLALVLESIALAVDADDGGVMQQPVEHRDGQDDVAGEGAVPTAEGKIGSENHRAALVAEWGAIAE